VKKALIVATLLIFGWAPAHTQESATLRFEVTLGSDLISSPQDGRLFVILGRTSGQEPRTSIGQTGFDAAPVFAHDLKAFAPGATGVIDQSAAAFPIESLSRLPAGDYFVQALFDSNIDLKSVNAPGNLYSAPQWISFRRFDFDDVGTTVGEQFGAVGARDPGGQVDHGETR